MKARGTFLVLLMSLFAMSVISCINDELTDSQAPGAGKILSVAEQVAAIEATMSDIESLQTALGERSDADLEAAASALESHVADLKSGVSLIDATMATLEQQRKLASVTGAIAAADEEGDLDKCLANLEKGVKAWLGKTFTEYYPAAFAEAQASVRLSGLDIRSQKINVEGLLSDVEAGLRQTSDPEELKTLAAAVTNNADEAEKILAVLAELTDEVATEYEKAVAAAINEPENFDAPAVKSVNRAVAATIAETQDDLTSLASRVAACETLLASIQERLGELEAEVGDVDALLNMIQSVTFMSEYSAENAIAYYTIGSNVVTEDGKKQRIPAKSITLNYLVRPAAAAKPLKDPNLWNQNLKVIGYYAEAITKSGVQTFDLIVTNVDVDAVSGLVTVTVSNAFDSEDFYMEKTGAKVALSITSGKTDITSKFVEIVPKDASNTVYAESLTVTESVQIELNESVSLKAVLTPLGADQTLTWTSDNEDVVRVSGEGVLTTTGVGTAIVTATSATTDEYGRHLTATCNVTVNPDIKIVGPKFVEEGYSINLRLDCPRNINPEQITWTVSNPSAITVQKTTVDGMNCAVVEGNAVAYNGGYEDITITCAIAGETTLTHTVQCVVVQPRDIDITGLTAEEEEKNEITLKFSQSRTLGASIVPDNVDAGKFTLAYGNSGEGLIRSNQTITAKGENDLKNGKVIGYFNVEVNSDWYWYDKTFQTIADKITRKIAVNVEPYYITSLSIPASQNMTIDQVLNQLPDITFTSDDPSHEPSYTDLTWASSASEYVSVNETTGELNAHQVTTEPVKITASIKNPEISVKPGVTVADAVCWVNVTEAAASDPHIGDYYFADGTFATELPTGYDHSTSDNKVIGIIFYLGNVTKYDTRLVTDGYDSCVNGLVVSIDEYNSYPGNFHSYKAAYENMTYPFDTEYARGYTNTVQLSEYGDNNGSGYAKMYRYDLEGVPGIHSSSVTSPASPWYVPSFAEMRLLYTKLSEVNNSLNALSKQIEAKDYWTSTFTRYNNTNEIGSYNTYSLSSNAWGGTSHSTQPSCVKEFPVRLILAF